MFWFSFSLADKVLKVRTTLDNWNDKPTSTKSTTNRMTSERDDVEDGQCTRDDAHGVLLSGNYASEHVHYGFVEILYGQPRIVNVSQHVRQHVLSVTLVDDMTVFSPSSSAAARAIRSGPVRTLVSILNATRNANINAPAGRDRCRRDAFSV